MNDTAENQTHGGVHIPILFAPDAIAIREVEREARRRLDPSLWSYLDDAFTKVFAVRADELTDPEFACIGLGVKLVPGVGPDDPGYADFARERIADGAEWLARLIRRARRRGTVSLN